MMRSEALGGVWCRCARRNAPERIEETRA